jgi:mannose-6-phosphate isomerase-like protein (cupin superfamily)
MIASSVHTFDANRQDWGRHELFPAIQIKVLESRATHPGASIMLVQLAVGGVIETHQHELETESALVLAGQGLLTCGDDPIPFIAGSGASIPPRTPHSLRNTGAVPLELVAIHTPPVR